MSTRSIQRQERPVKVSYCHNFNKSTLELKYKPIFQPTRSLIELLWSTNNDQQGLANKAREPSLKEVLYHALILSHQGPNGIHLRVQTPDRTGRSLSKWATAIMATHLRGLYALPP